MTDFLRYPSIPYLRTPPDDSVRSDKVLSTAEREELLSHELRVEEKIDGENLGISANGDRLVFQVRGSYVEPGGRRFHGLFNWAQPRAPRLIPVLGGHLIVFGEWCRVTHSVSYDRLPDWFLVFDVFDRSRQCFWDPQARDDFAEELGLSVVPFLAAGEFTEAQLQALIGMSRVGHERAEGVVMRVTDCAGPTPRAKLVRGSFHQMIGEHWMRGERHFNRLVHA